MESSFLPKYEPKIVKISALSVAQHRAEILTIFCSYFERKAKSCELYKDILENFKMTFLPLFQTPNILQDIEIYHGLRLFNMPYKSADCSYSQESEGQILNVNSKGQ